MDLLDALLHPQKVTLRYSPFHEGLTEGQANELRFIFNRVREGEHRARIHGSRTYATYDPAVRAAYALDSTSLPMNVDRLIKRTPGAVVLPGRRTELIELLRFAYDTSLPITPRGGGTGHWGGAVPAEGGIMVDMRGFDDVLEVDAEEHRVRVEGGVTWGDLEKVLNEQDLAVRAHPFSSPFGTVAGWVATGGGGFGSFKYGSVRALVDEVVLLAPDGEVETLRGDDLDLVVGALGSTGLILEVVLKVRPFSETTVVGLAVETLDQVQQVVDGIGAVGAHSVHVVGPEFVDLLQEAMGARQLPRKQYSVLLTFEAAEAEAGQSRVEELADTVGGESLDPDVATWAWEKRFHHESFKQFGPSLAKGHVVVPKKDLAEAWSAGVEELEAPEWAVWAVAVAPDEFLLQASVLADERLPNYSLAIGNAMAFAGAATRHGGRPYAAGLLEAGSAKQVLGKERYKRIKAWKGERDPREIMNPGKVTSARVKGAPFVRLASALRPGVGAFKALRGEYEHRRGSGPDTSNRALQATYGRVWSPRLAEMADDLHKYSTTGLTNTLGDLHKGITYESEKPRTIVQARRFETQLPRGVVAAGLAILRGAEPGADVAAHALTLPAVPTYQALDPNEAPVLEAIEAVREAGQKAMGLEPAVNAIVNAVDETGNIFGEPADGRGDWLPGGTPTGFDTTTLLVAGDVGAYQRPDDAAAAFRILNNARFGFTSLAAKEVHVGTVPYRLGAVDAAARTCQAFADAAENHLDDRLPTTLLALSNEDADVLRRRIDALLEGSDHADWRPSVLTLPQVLDALVSSGRLSFQGAGTDQPPQEDEEPEAEPAEEAEEDAEAEDEAAEDEADGDAGFEELEITVVHSPFSSDEDRAALNAVAQALPGITINKVVENDVLFPDISYQLTHTVSSQELVGRAEEALEGQALVGCTDLAHVLKEGKVDVVTLQELVAERMEVLEGGGVDLAVEQEDEGDAFQEFDIPDGAHRVELVKENAAIPVYPDESILDAAEAHGFEMPYDCRAGSCVTCCARFEGTPPDQSEGQSLSEEEQEDHVLTCIAKPKGDVKIHSGEQP